MVENKFNQNNKNQQQDKQPNNQGSSSKEWNDSEVKLLKKWAELSASYRVLHDRAHRYFKFRNYCFTIPVIIFSTILGTASFSQDTFPEPYKSYMPMGIGSLNIISGIITTIAQFTRVSELSEANRVASISYGKFSRNIATELSLPPEFRSYSGIDFVQICRSEFDRLVEQSPIIPLDILNEFMKEIEDENIEKPDIMKVSPIEEYKPTKEEKAARIIANAFQTMHNRSKEKSGVQKMAELVERKGLNIINKASNAVNNTPTKINNFINNAANNGKNFINNFSNQKKDIENQIYDEIENNIEEEVIKENTYNIKQVQQNLTPFINKQIESRQNELNKMSNNNVVGRILQNSPFGSSMRNLNIKKEISNTKNIGKNIINNVKEDIKENINNVKQEVSNEINNVKEEVSNEINNVKEDIINDGDISIDHLSNNSTKNNKIKSLVDKAKKELNNNIENTTNIIHQIQNIDNTDNISEISNNS